MTANIRPKADSHEHCAGYANPIGSPMLSSVGDVRECSHGKVQVVYEPYINISGPGTYMWRDIRKVLERSKYKRAIMALRGGKNDAAEGTG